MPAQRPQRAWVDRRPAANALDRSDELKHRRPSTGAQVKRIAGAAVQQVLERSNVGAGQVSDMDVVADRGAIRRGVVRAVKIERRALAEGREDRQRNGVSLGVVAFAEIVIGIGPAALKYRRIIQRRP